MRSIPERSQREYYGRRDGIELTAEDPTQGGEESTSNLQRDVRVTDVPALLVGGCRGVAAGGRRRRRGRRAGVGRSRSRGCRSGCQSTRSGGGVDYGRRQEFATNDDPVRRAGARDQGGLTGGTGGRRRGVDSCLESLDVAVEQDQFREQRDNE